MTERLEVSAVRFVAAGADLQRSGLLGWVSCTFNGTLKLDGLALRRAADGRHLIAFPGRTDRGGRLHHYIRPLDDRTRREIEWQILSQLGLGEEWA